MTGAGGEHARLLRVDRELARPVLRWTDVPGDDELDGADRLRRLLEPPFDLANPPLWRFELLDAGARGQVLAFGAHHAVSDLQSLLLVAGNSTPNCPAPRSATPSPTGTSIS